MNSKKTNFRRLLVVLTAMLVGVTFISVSCSVDRLCHLEVVMKNTLPMELTIKTKDCSFVTTQDSSYHPSQTITIPPQGEVSVVWDYRYQINYPQYFDDNQCDSMWIVFNDSVQIVFSKEDRSRFNPILMENYEVLAAENSWDGCLRYTFTEKDYQNAAQQEE